MVLNMLQENNNNDNTTTTALSSQGSPTSSSYSSFTNEYDTSNYFYRLPNETIFTILAFVITNVSTTTTTTTTTATASIYPPHKQIAVLSQVCQLFNKIASETLLWQIAFETKFDSEAIIRAGIVENNVIDEECSFGGFGSTEGEGKGHKIMTTQIQNSSSSFVQIQTGGDIWKELYKERQIALNKIKNYIEPTSPSPFVYRNNNNSENDDASTTVYLDDFMEFHFDDESESDNENDVTNHGDSSTLDSTDQVDDNVDYQLFDFDFNFVGNEKNEPRTEETGRNNLDFALEDDEEFRLNGTLEDNMEFTTGGTVKEHTIEEHTIKEDVVKENVVKEELPKQNITTEFNLEDDLEYTEMNSTSAINVDDVVQDLDFVSDGLIKFDDPELDSIFASDTIEIDNFIDAQDSNVVEIGENDAPRNEVLVKDTGNSAKEVDHIVQAQGLLNPEINDDLDETYLQDYDESSKLPDYEEETFKSPDYEGSSSKLQNFDQDEPQLQNYEESLTKLQDFDQGESKLLEDSSSKLPDKDYSILNELINDDLPDYDENEEVSQLHDYDENINRTDLQDYNKNEELQNFNENNENEKSIDYQDFKVNQVENPSKEITINEQQESDLPAYDENDEITNLLNDDEVKTNLQNENIIIENDDNIDLLNFVEDEEENLFNENLINEREVNNKEETIKENNLPNGNIVYDTENEQPNYDENEIRQDYENGNLDFDEHGLGNDDDDDENEEMNDNGQFYQGLNNLIFTMNNQVLEYGNNRRIRSDDSELLKILNIVWKICQENDGMNSEVLLESNIKELTVSLIQSLDKMEAQIECLSIALQILSILVSWHPELTIDLHKNNSFWTTIHDIMINFDIFFTESENNNNKIKQLALPASAGSAIHIFFHTIFFNLTNPNELVNNYISPPQFIPDSNIFNNVYNKLELKPGEGMIQPFEEGLSGKWCGYSAYSSAYSSSRPVTDSAMDFTLEFSSCKPGKVYYLNLIGDNPVRVTDKVVKEFSGSGIDEVGEFVIKHGIITEKGNVNFIKTYIGRHSWTYDGILLPVGICGRWGTKSGNFWIWKS